MAAYSFSLKLVFPSGVHARQVMGALLPDFSSPHSRRSATSVSVKKNILSAVIKASDAVALRASVNGLLKKIILADSILEVE